MTMYTQKILDLGKAYPRMSVTNLGLLLTLYDLGRATANELAKIIAMEPAGVREQLTRFSERGLTTITNVDGKMHHLLTGEARTIINGVFDYEL